MAPEWWRTYVPARQRAREAQRELAKLRKRGRAMSPVVIDPRRRAIAHTFWGKAWCQNLERYSDYANRLPRGRSYVRNGSVLHLEVAPGEVEALVRGSRVYKVKVKVSAVPKARWSVLCAGCTGEIDSLVELLQGRFSAGVMERICQQGTGLFPSPGEINLSCSCPDWASMCKHVAAVLYGIGARLDERPELLFELRRVDQEDLITAAGGAMPLAKGSPSASRLLVTSDLSELFGVEIAAPPDEGDVPGSRVPQTMSARLIRAKREVEADTPRSRGKHRPPRRRGTKARGRKP